MAAKPAAEFDARYGAGFIQAEQFVQMIALQRGFQANSKTIQASDDNYVTLVQLRR